MKDVRAGKAAAADLKLLVETLVCRSSWPNPAHLAVKRFCFGSGQSSVGSDLQVGPGLDQHEPKTQSAPGSLLIAWCPAETPTARALLQIVHQLTGTPPPPSPH